MAPKKRKADVSVETLTRSDKDEKQTEELPVEPSPAKKAHADAKHSSALKDEEVRGPIRNRLMDCASYYDVMHDVTPGSVEWNWMHKMYCSKCAELKPDIGNPVLTELIVGLISLYKDYAECGISQRDKAGYRRAIEFMTAVKAGTCPMAPGAAETALEDGDPSFCDPRKDEKCMAADVQAQILLVAALVYPVKRFTAGGMNGFDEPSIMDMPDGTTKMIRAGTEEFKRYWEEYKNNRSFQPCPHNPGISDAYMWKDPKKPSEWDEIDKELVATRDPLKPDGSCLGHHTYGGYHGFFRPSLDEVIPLMIKAGVKFADPTLKRIYVNTEPFPSDRPGDCYDNKANRHRALTMWWILRK
jgi:hypothetical protein